MEAVLTSCEVLFRHFQKGPNTLRPNTSLPFSTLPLAITGSAPRFENDASECEEGEFTAPPRRTEVCRMRCSELQGVTVRVILSKTVVATDMCPTASLYIALSIFLFQQTVHCQSCELPSCYPPPLTCLSVLDHRPGGLRRHQISRPFAACRGARKGHGP
jgi:hypothetical protein